MDSVTSRSVRARGSRGLVEGPAEAGHCALSALIASVVAQIAAILTQIARVAAPLPLVAFELACVLPRLATVARTPISAHFAAIAMDLPRVVPDLTAVLADLPAILRDIVAGKSRSCDPEQQQARNGCKRLHQCLHIPCALARASLHTPACVGLGAVTRTLDSLTTRTPVGVAFE